MSEGRGFGRGDRGRGGRGDRGRGGRGRGRGRGKPEEKEWVPVTKLGRLVKENKLRKLEEIFTYSLPVKEYQIIDEFLPQPGKLKDEVMKVHPTQKQTKAGQRTRFKAFVVVGDEDGHVGLGVRSSKEVANAIRAALINAKLNLIPVRRGFWGGKLGQPHTVPCKVTGVSGSVLIRLIPAPRGAGVVAAPATKKVLQFAGIADVFTKSTGQTRTMGNFVKAVFDALCQTYGFLTPDLWAKTHFDMDPYQEHTDFLAAGMKKL
eukprot:NODE_5428_length_947_cov_552.504854_g5210_i0.p1 GENE.NODE_5428_length_947_cov_552.504854_g5210_i0~~NODE_5428_length_947_cov_552.504854_g5210_i0.p1  ORF type:complete len:282 (+),score=79.08 NODE_5428_length_947_cov_552.504854_g5210_i0:62-847(+)